MKSTKSTSSPTPTSSSSTSHFNPRKRPASPSAAAASSSTSAAATTTTSITTNNPQNSELTQKITTLSESLIPQTLFRLTEGLPRHELKMMSDEAKECEECLLKEIKILEEAIGWRQTTTTTTTNNNKTTNDNKQPTTTISLPSPDKQQQPRPSPPPILLNALGYYDTMGGLNYHTSVDAMLTSELAPPDRFDTVSALIGRLRLPLNDGLHPPNSTIALARRKAQVMAAASSSSASKKSQKKSSSSSSSGGGGGGGGGSGGGGGGDATTAADLQLEFKVSMKFLEKQKALMELERKEIYRREQTEQTALLALWKRVSSHRTGTVFRRPVNAREAPRYADKILFPIDLSLIRKMITAGIIVSFADLHQRIGLMCHNCVKFNGRESDYGVITREFEAYVDDSVLEAVAKAENAAGQNKSASGGNSR